MGQRLTPTIKCEICFIRFKALSGHLKKHRYNVKKYKTEFNAPVISPLTKRRMQLSRLRFILKKKNGFSDAVPKNIKRSVVRQGYKHSEETKEKIRQARLGSTLSKAHKLAISAGLLGHEVSDATREKLRNVEVSLERRKRISDAQTAEKGNAWKGGISRYLYFGKGKYRLKRIFGDPLKCFYPECDKEEGKNVKSIDCHHIDGNHENNPLDGSNWLPLCRRHHMLADGRLPGITKDQAEDARVLTVTAHTEYLRDHYIGEIKSYHD